MEQTQNRVFEFMVPEGININSCYRNDVLSIIAQTLLDGERDGWILDSDFDDSSFYKVGQLQYARCKCKKIDP
jgi:hypothetical protein